MNTHGNNLFGFSKDTKVGAFVNMSHSSESSDTKDMHVGDPISQNFSGSGYSNMDHDEFADMSGWKTFFMSTFQPKKYKAKRLDEAREGVDKKYPLEGSCSVLEDRMTKLQDEISKNVYSEGGKGAARVSERQITALKERREELKEEKEKECYVDPEVQQQMAQQFQQEMADKTRKKNIIGYSIMGVLLVGAGIGAYFMFRKKGKGKKKK